MQAIPTHYQQIPRLQPEQSAFWYQVNIVYCQGAGRIPYTPTSGYFSQAPVLAEACLAYVQIQMSEV